MAETGSKDRESAEATRERVRSLCESVSELKQEIKEIETRVREMEGHVSSFKTVSDDRQEKLKMGLNFFVQLLWVVTAAYILTKLGIGMGPV